MSLGLLLLTDSPLLGETAAASPLRTRDLGPRSVVGAPSRPRGPVAKSGEIDEDGEIVDEALLARVARLRRLTSAIGKHRADDVDVESQLRLTLALLKARA